ncbi:fumarylacetoacetate hydrolase family protein [Micrococcus sp.]|uniref:fumarylacetoacetate hydrolase family protein n=1 Tax=Micrococcus sp. TaxID=1271 RepID=UPI0026DB5A4B|nr:fumarylacetoacetate hydrolase family protein [Micrococcus sp.]MDO4238760.1 fumarylacetoacetate hydrolase family protein [Micrococcus sp.]
MALTIAPDSLAARHGSEGFDAHNLPYASASQGEGERRLVVRLGDQAVDLTALVRAADLTGPVAEAAGAADLTPLLELDADAWNALRAAVQGAVTAPGSAEELAAATTPVADLTLHLPFTPADYVDFYASEHHASNVGRIFRPDQDPLLPNWKRLPVGYHGRAGTLIASGTDVPRPKGLRPSPDGPPLQGEPSYGPSRRLDIEAEIGFVLGGSRPRGEVTLEEARRHVFGLVLVNDWSARDIQAYEYVPLGPNLAKSFATSVGAWVVPLAALDAARVAPPARDEELAEYLDDSSLEPWGFDIAMEVELDGEVVSRPPFAQMYWTGAQMLAHMTTNNACLRPGDFFASGTVSGPEKAQRGSFLELSWGGEEPFQVNGEDTTFLEDGHTVAIRGTAPGPDGSVVSLGEVTGTVLPAT